jgi:hypothetical protein
MLRQGRRSGQKDQNRCEDSTFVTHGSQPALEVTMPAGSMYPSNISSAHLLLIPMMWCFQKVMLQAVVRPRLNPVNAFAGKKSVTVNAFFSGVRMMRYVHPSYTVPVASHFSINTKYERLL